MRVPRREVRDCSFVWRGKGTASRRVSFRIAPQVTFRYCGRRRRWPLTVNVFVSPALPLNVWYV